MKRHALIFLIYFTIYIISIILPIISNNNFSIANYIFYLSLPYFIINVFALPKQSIITASIISSVFVLVLVISKIRNSEYELDYFLIDFVKVFIAYYLINFIGFNLSKKTYSIFLLTSIILIIINLIVSIHPSYYIANRFAGSLKNGNMTVYLISFSSAYIELYLRNSTLKIKQKQLILAAIITIIIFFSVISESRSYIFVLIYFVYIAKLYFRPRTIIFLSLLMLTAFFSLNMHKYFMDNALIERFSTHETSYLTRLRIYDELLIKIKHSFLLPNGFNSDQLYIQSIVKNKEMHAHNDILKYIYDYGVFFILLLVVLFKKIKDYNFEQKREVYLLSIVYLTTFLHGYLFIYLFMFPFAMTLNYKYNIQRL